jgi:predicted SprT family Zn-dependent metalloprotease
VNRIARMNKRVSELFELAHQLYGLNLRRTEIRYDLRGRKAGKARCRFCTDGLMQKYSVHFNRQVIEGDEFEDVLKNVTAHEVAHICAFMDPRLGKDHDEGWRRVCLALGGNGEMYHSYRVTYNGGNYHYTTTTGHEVVISANRHARVQKGTRYRVRNKGWIDRSCAFRKDSGRNDRKVAQPSSPSSIPATPKREKAGSFVSQVRQWIRDLKPRGVSQHTLIAMAIELGMRPSSARSAVVGCWDRV